MPERKPREVPTTDRGERMNDEPDVIVATEADLRIAVRRSLARIGLTFTELEAKHAAGDLDQRERRAWVAIGDLGDLADDPTPTCSCTFVRDWTCTGRPGPDGLCDHCRRDPICRKHREAKA